MSENQRKQYERQTMLDPSTSFSAKKTADVDGVFLTRQNTEKPVDNF